MMISLGFQKYTFRVHRFGSIFSLLLVSSSEVQNYFKKGNKRLMTQSNTSQTWSTCNSSFVAKNLLNEIILIEIIHPNNSSIILFENAMCANKFEMEEMVNTAIWF